MVRKKIFWYRDYDEMHEAAGWDCIPCGEGK